MNLFGKKQHLFTMLRIAKNKQTKKNTYFLELLYGLEP